MGQRTTRENTYDELILKMLVYGEGGAGKTRFIRTFDDDPRTSRILILSFAGNPVSILMEDPEPYVIECGRPEDVNLPWRFLIQGQPEEHPFRKEYGIPPDVTFKSVAIDTLTEVQRQVNGSITGAEKIPTGFKKLRIQDWGDSFGHMLNIARLFYEDLTQSAHPIHVIMSVQQRTDVGTDDKVERIHVALQGQAKGTIHQYAELCPRLERRTLLPKNAPAGSKPQAATIAFFDMMGKAWAKNQLSLALGQSMPQPTITKIMDIVLASPQWQQAK